MTAVSFVTALPLRSTPADIQGRITKVLNMKPPEILGMIEEAAGTRMFEHKKQSAQKTILKKQQKVSKLHVL